MAGWLGDAVKIKIKAPPERGKANAAVIDLLASRLSIDKRLIQIASGHSSSCKILSVDGLDDCQLVTAVNTAIA